MSRPTRVEHYTLRADAMTSAARFLRTLPISGKGFALLGSVSVHAVVALAAARGAPHAALNANLPSDAAVEIAALELALTEAPLARPSPPMSTLPAAPARHHHDYPVPPDHDATAHSPNIIHALPVPNPLNSAPASAPTVVDSHVPATPRFTMTVALAPRPSTGTGAEGGNAPRGESAGAEAAPEASVDTPAKRLIGDSPRYTAEAQAAGVEADVPLEIVVDGDGAVIGARALSRVGYGLDEAALRSVRSYRFSPARRAGKAVAVRMRWLMRFQLR